MVMDRKLMQAEASRAVIAHCRWALKRRTGRTEMDEAVRRFHRRAIRRHTAFLKAAGEQEQ